MSFLNAEWRKLVMVNYKIDPNHLMPFVPKGTEIDNYKGDYYISLVGFQFENTKIKGIKIPFHINFPEVNLRFYVRCYQENEWRRGVVFIKEIVPKPAITWVANTIYKENYETLKMRSVLIQNDEHFTSGYYWTKNGKEMGVSVKALHKPFEIASNSVEEFITEHYWGYAIKNETTTNFYEVKHPRWLIYPVESHELNVNFEATYGSEWAFLNQLHPDSILIAEGSEISVEGVQKLVL